MANSSDGDGSLLSSTNLCVVQARRHSKSTLVVHWAPTVKACEQASTTGHIPRSDLNFSYY